MVLRATPNPVTYLAMDLVLGQCFMLRWARGGEGGTEALISTHLYPGPHVPTLLQWGRAEDADWHHTEAPSPLQGHCEVGSPKDIALAGASEAQGKDAKDTNISALSPCLFHGMPMEAKGTHDNISARSLGWVCQGVRVRGLRMTA